MSLQAQEKKGVKLTGRVSHVTGIVEARPVVVPRNLGAPAGSRSARRINVGAKHSGFLKLTILARFRSG